MRLVVLASAGMGMALAACSGGSSEPAVQRPTTPAAGAPGNVIAFGAQDQNGAHALYLVAPDAAGLRKLSDEGGAVSSPRWSPGGDRVAYLTAPGSLRLFDFATSKATTIAEGTLTNDLGAPLSWSPKGDRLAYIDGAGGGRMRMYDVGARVLLDIGDVPALAVEWSSTSETLAIVRAGSTPQQTEIDTVNSDGTNARQIIAADDLKGAPAWSLDGKQLAVWSAPSPQVTARTLAIYKPNGDRQRDLGAGLDPAWAADGRLAFSRPQSANSGAAIDLYVLPKEGDPQLAVQATALARWPVWAPQSDALVYLAEVDRNTTLLCTAVLATDKRNCIELGSLQPGQPAWSPF
jgi:Tol biopolymer transport system component